VAAPTIVPCPPPLEPGLTAVSGGAVIGVESRHARSVHLCLFDEEDSETARLRLPCRTGDLHHGFVAGLEPGHRYGLRVDGPSGGDGHRFDPSKLLVDPYALRLDRPFAWHPALAEPGAETERLVPKAIFEMPAPARRVERPAPPTLIYELGVKAFSMLHPDVPAELKGTLRALCCAPVIAHLKRIGVSHVELLPIAAWIDERHLPPLGLANAWGYNPVTFLALDPRLAPGGAGDLEAAVGALRGSGIGVILDVVFNHTGESDAAGPTLSLRGLDNALYFRHAADDADRLVNDTGCGNTLACDRPAVMHLVLAALRRWRRCGVDGFRFDLATTLGRDQSEFSRDAPLLAAIARDPELAGCILIAEPWDLGPGGYCLGEFPAPYFEWNGRFRDDMRRFWRGDHDAAGGLARGLAGSAELLAPGHRPPSASINYIASHDGFPLADVTTYARKHNLANGEENRDGSTENWSWNNGEEGLSDDLTVKEARRTDARALLATLFIARGTPMLLAGDEGGRTQHGNNNAYAQDNESFWLDWTTQDPELTDYVSSLMVFRRWLSTRIDDRHPTGGAQKEGSPPDVVWTTLAGHAMAAADWAPADAFILIMSAPHGARVAAAFNRGREAQALTLPNPGDGLAWTEAFQSASDGNAFADRTICARSVAVYVEEPDIAARNTARERAFMV
jgi:glycogen debranching enzyme